MHALPYILPNLIQIMIFLLFNRQIFPIILNWRIFWILVVQISRSVVSRSVTLVLVVQSLVIQPLVIQSLFVQPLVIQPLVIQWLAVQSDQLCSIGADMTSATSLSLSIYNLLLYDPDQ